MLKKSNLINEINEILEKTGSPCIIVEDGQIKSVILSIDQYKKLANQDRNKKQLKNYQVEINSSLLNNDFNQQKDAFLDKVSESGEITSLAEDEIIKKMKEKLDYWREKQNDIDELNSSIDQKNNFNNNSNIDKEKSKINHDERKEQVNNDEISLNDLPIE